ncbi:putative RNA polymerase-associated protein LEO1 [Leptomonas pyrrhocoris]|uniref:Putative RNA polymerase-associated protein LEO1 n=1 Tax=Leptomonas pyrrhocoris TaxID=157538 RepID=A0A0M9GAK2_LEPPY|nr:putative RNA polymerase-associated protein LEO1 [Leptomonas pyrrhocoris]KPA86283.1 putative RNA polymerase-associated protein LEO1 [Leptomonas pyrrhocoris]|eukprot:XP_015664722.1 putative RNA polymerase-associated protein LEO1 [Leptomonas pyrrhocoris]
MDATEPSLPAEATAPAAETLPEKEEGHVTPPRSPVAAATATGDEEEVFLTHAADAVSPFAALTMETLFGPAFRVGEDDRKALKDPALIDTRAILQELFGPAVREDDVDLFVEERYGAENVAKEMRTNKELLVYAEGERYFGAASAQVLRSDEHVPFTLLESTLPPVWSEEQGRSSTPAWLLEMPAIYPNRQTLHADPRPCDPSTCDYLESNKYVLYTPSNVLRWTVEGPTCSSNGRVVRWSDGSVTLHVGGDVLALTPSQEPTLHLLGEPLEVGKAGMEIDAMIGAIAPEKHLSAGLGGAASIEAALAQERRQRELGNSDRNLPFADLSMPPIDWSRPRKGRTIQEEFVREEYENREKEMKRRIREGRPMTLAEQLRLEAQLQDHVTGATAEELQTERDDALRQATLKAAQRAENRGVKRNRFDRDLDLQGGTGGEHHGQRDPFLEDDEGREEEEEGEGGEEDDDQRSDSFERQLAEMYARNNSDDAAERKKIKTETAATSRYDGLAAALRALLTQIPMNAEAFASVDGTLSFLGMDNTPDDVVKTEVPKMLTEVAAELPTVNTQRVQQELSALFPEGTH